METTTMTPTQKPARAKLPTQTTPRADRHSFPLHIPLTLWERMIKSGAVSWGTTTNFILEAITEKLDRMAKKEAKQ